MIARNYPFKIKQIPANKRAGKVIPNPLHPKKPDELICANILARFGSDVIFLPESSYLSGPDCIWRKEKWEIKTLHGNSLDNTMHAIKAAVNQSPNIIINATKTKRDLYRIALDVLYSFNDIKTNKPSKVLIVTRNESCLVLRSMVK